AQVNLFTTEAEKRPCRAYHCVYCGRFHLTSVSGGSRSEPESD
ncbi:MAG: hypothetical protein RJA98_221, partial [Pseudomonadota bacterium]